MRETLSFYEDMRPVNTNSQGMHPPAAYLVENILHLFAGEA